MKVYIKLHLFSLLRPGNQVFSIISLCFLFLLGAAPLVTFSQQSDSLKYSNDWKWTFRFSGMPEELVMKNHYVYKANFTDQGRSANICYPVQRLYDSLGVNLTMAQLYSIADNKDVREIIYAREERWYRNSFTEKEIMWAAWRNATVRITDENELPDVMQEGVDLMLSNGYSDLSSDILPFVSMLMEEQRYYHFDDSRIIIGGGKVGGIVDITRFFEVLRSMDNTQHAGVCRDVHDAGLRMLRPVLSEYYKNIHPDLTFNPDEYLYLQSWVTTSGQHVTTTFIDPYDRKLQYELDWGKVVEKTNHYGYDNGRNYGTVFRMWRFDSQKDLTVPLTFAFTETGKLLNSHFFDEDDELAFSGMREKSYYNEISALHQKKKNHDLSFAAGILSQSQYYATGTYRYFQKEKIWWNFIKYNAKAGLQLFLKEDHLRKNTFMNEENSAILSLTTQPRYQTTFSNIPVKIGKRSAFHFYINCTADFISVLYKSFGESTASFSKTGDAGLYMTQGFQLDVKPAAGTKLFLRMQNRSYLIANEVRRMAPNPIDLFPHSVLSSPGQNIIAGYSGQYIWGNIGSEINLDFEKQGCIFIQPILNSGIKLNRNSTFVAEFSAIRQLKGETYYWLPADMLFSQAGILFLKHNYFLGLNFRNQAGEYNSAGLMFRAGF